MVRVKNQCYTMVRGNQVYTLVWVEKPTLYHGKGEKLMLYNGKCEKPMLYHGKERNNVIPW